MSLMRIDILEYFAFGRLSTPHLRVVGLLQTQDIDSKMAGVRFLSIFLHYLTSNEYDVCGGPLGHDATLPTEMGTISPKPLVDSPLKNFIVCRISLITQ